MVKFKFGAHCIYVSPSIGIDTTLTYNAKPDTLVCHADSAMYRAKSLGGNNVQFYDSTKNKQVKNQLQTESALHDAVNNDEFLLHYQPQVNPATGNIVSCEALVRWQHPDKGIQLPGSFISIIEQNGLILPIGSRILHQACAQLSQWQKKSSTRCTLCVNLSARQFNEKSLLDDILQLILKYKLNPSWLELEVTESILINDLVESIKTLSALRDIGVGIALDDFGTGYSSLSYLKQLPITTLKIDQSFISELPGDNKSSAITKLLLGLAKDLDMKVVAEGVETWEQYELLKNEGCDLIQGYFISKPVNSHEFESILEENYDRSPHIAQIG